SWNRGRARCRPAPPTASSRGPRSSASRSRRSPRSSSPTPSRPPTPSSSARKSRSSASPASSGRPSSASTTATRSAPCSFEEKVMDFGKLTVEYRKGTGKTEARRLRASGLVPGICYGPGGQPVPISLSARELKKALHPEKRQNTVIHVTVNGGDGGPREL